MGFLPRLISDLVTFRAQEALDKQKEKEQKKGKLKTLQGLQQDAQKRAKQFEKKVSCVFHDDQEPSPFCTIHLSCGHRLELFVVYVRTCVLYVCLEYCVRFPPFSSVSATVGGGDDWDREHGVGGRGR